MKKTALFFIDFYRAISFLFPVKCKYIPTCSEYARQAFLNYSFGRALKLSLFRILRCHPFSKGGLDSLRVNDVSNSYSVPTRTGSESRP